MSDGENSEPPKKKAKAKPPKNLAPHLWKKGQSGNPGGRPRDTLGLAALARNDVPKLSESSWLSWTPWTSDTQARRK